MLPDDMDVETLVIEANGLLDDDTLLEEKEKKKQKARAKASAARSKSKESKVRCGVIKQNSTILLILNFISFSHSYILPVYIRLY